VRHHHCCVTGKGTDSAAQGKGMWARAKTVLEVPGIVALAGARASR
jgi:hypothetical protein